VELSIHNMLGQKVRTLVDEAHATGDYQVEWNGQNDVGEKVASGVYFYRLSTGNEVQTKKMLMMK
jgi:flagellar hook assembly protein FlgD